MFRYLLLIVTVLFASCTSNNISDDITPVSIQVAFGGFDISTSPMMRAGETSSTIPSNIDRLALKVFNSNNEAVASILQKKEESGFGIVSFTLVPGDYTFVCILNATEATNNEIAPATITSPEVANIPGTVVHDTYCCSQPVAITGNTTSVNLQMGSRVNARFTLKVTDAIPSEPIAQVKSVGFVIDPGGNNLSGSIEINPSTGCTTMPYRFSASKALDQGATTIPEMTIDIYLLEKQYNTTVKIMAQDGNNQAIPAYSRELSVVFAQNKQVKASGHIFDPTASLTFNFDNISWTESNVTF